MLGLLLCAEGTILRAYSGIVDIPDPQPYFVPPVYDLAEPDDFYRIEEANITAINHRVNELEQQLSARSNVKDSESRRLQKLIADCRQERKQRSLALQKLIFEHFNFLNAQGEERNIMQIFADAHRGLPPGGAGECAAPRLLQEAYRRGLHPLAMCEFWYGLSPRREIRLHRQFYPSCIEKCSPILSYMLGGTTTAEAPTCTDESPRILFEDGNLIVVHKPAGMLSVPAKDLTLPCLEAFLHAHCPDVKGPMLIHRLDQATSGIMLAAKDAATHKALQQQLESHLIRKRYLALLSGHLPSQCGIINLPICPNPDDRPRQTVDRQFGKPSLTLYEVIERRGTHLRGDAATLVAFHPLTGRTHQLRMHSASPFGLDAPILGDELYFSRPDAHLRLHADSISFTHPISGQPLTFSDPDPQFSPIINPTTHS